MQHRQKTAFTKTLIALAVANSLAAPSLAATITVTTTADNSNTDGQCSLREAVQAINAQAASADCPNSGEAFGNDVDRIQSSLTPPLAFSLSSRIQIGVADSPRTVNIDLGRATIVPDFGNGAFEVREANVNFNNMSITGANIEGNTASIGGGAISVFSGTMTLNNFTLANNTVSGVGGAIYAGMSSTVILQNSTITAGRASNGGGIALFDSTLQVRYSTISANSVGRSGGAIFADNSAVTITNSSIVSNQASGSGGAIILDGSVVTLNNATVNANSASTGGGIYISADSTLVMDQSIIANSQGQDCYLQTATSTVTANIMTFAIDEFSIIADASCNAFVRAVNPILGPLQDNGGSTQTNALFSFSPARDSGGSNCRATDQRGQPRIDGRCDIGAFEFNDFRVEVTSIADDNGTGCTLREAIYSTEASALQPGCQSHPAGVLFNDDQQIITFSPTLPGNRIGLTNGDFELQSRQLTIAGGNDGIIIDANGSSRHFSVDASGLTLESVTLINGSTSAAGGAILAQRFTGIDLKNSTISGNTAGRGGGIAVYNAELLIANSVLSANTATSSGYSGGAIYLYRANMGLLHSTISNNSAAGRGGGITGNQADPQVSYSTLSGNSANFGGGISLRESTLRLINSTISSNSASVGGGVYAFRQSQVNLNHATVADNQGNGIALDHSNANLINTIVANSQGGDCYDIEQGLFSYDAGSISADGSCGGHNIDPQLLPLANNGGTTQTHALAESSPARNTGALNNCENNDQRGFDRQTDENGCDVGAVEFQPRDVPVNFFIIPLANGGSVTVPL